MGGRAQVRMTEEEVRAFLDGHLRAHVATLNRDGSIHLVPVHFARCADQLFFWTDPRAQKAVNLTRNPQVSVLVEDGGPFEERRGVSMRGTAEVVVGDLDLARRVGRDMMAKWPPPVAEEERSEFLALAGERAVVVVTPTRVLSWDHRKAAGATRQQLGR